MYGSKQLFKQPNEKEFIDSYKKQYELLYTPDKSKSAAQYFNMEVFVE
jgi:hypothetical protein